MAEKTELEVKDVLSFIGFEDVKDIEALKSGFNDKYVPVETHKQTLGEVNGRYAHAIKKGFKSIGVELDSDALKDVDTVDLPNVFAEKAKAKFDDLESKTKLTKEQLESELSGDLEKYKTQLKVLTAEKETLKTAYDTFKTETETANKTREINSFLGQAKNSLKFSDKVSEFERKGFHASVSEKYKFEVNEGKQAVRDDKGNLVMSKVNAGESATFEEVYNDEFKAADLGVKADTEKVRTFTPSASGTPPPSPRGGGRKVAARH